LGAPVADQSLSDGRPQDCRAWSRIFRLHHPSNLTIENLAGSVASDGWTYLGAFDGGLDLKFIPATAQRECNPTRMSEETPLLQGAARQQSRHASCSQQELAW
jgi:hypothetical protein